MNTRAPRTAAALAASLLFIFSCAAHAGAQTAAGEKIFSGWVGRHPVRMTLRRDAGGGLAGSYSYEGRAGSLRLKGMSGGQGGFTLEEFDGAKRTGVFKGRWREREYEPEATLQGEWARPGGGGGRSFTLVEELAAGPRLTSRRIGEENRARGYTVEAVYPRVEGAEKFNLLVARLVTKEVNDFKRGRGERPPAGAPPNSLRVGYRMRLANDRLQSVVFTVSRLEHGMAHHAYSFFVVNYDTKAGRRLALADLFEPGSGYLQRISAAAVERLRLLNKEDGDAYLQDPEAVENASAKPENYRHWTLTARGLAVTFEPYQVGPFAAGSPDVLIPYAELRDIISRGGPLAAHAN